MTNVWTDASRYQVDSTGTWAFIIEHDDRVYKKGGTIPHCRNSNDAELYAMVKATELLAVLIPNGGLVTYWTDSLHAIKIVYGGGQEYKTADDLISLINLINIQWTINYLPRNSTPQLAWCDKKTKEYYDT